jgi:hypothetical protein
LKDNDNEGNNKKEKLKIQLTTHGSTSMERLSYVSIKLDVQVTFNGDFSISLLAPLFDPILEIITQASENNITNVGAGHFVDLSYRR